jgi:hypothetical protein
MPSVREIRQFLRALWQDWLALMSSLASVTLSAIGAWYEKAMPGLAFWIAAIVCLLFAAFRVWQQEHQTVMQLERSRFSAQRRDYVVTQQETSYGETS